MHAPLPFQMTVRHFGVWRAACAVLCTAAVGMTALWAHAAAAAFPAWLMLSVLVVVGASVALLLHAWRLQPTSLRWDGQLWHLGPAETAGHEPWAGRLEVSLDLGSWLLLRFVPEPGAASRRNVWLPVQRAAHDVHWHALRATVYCARPVSLPTAAPF